MSATVPQLTATQLGGMPSDEQPATDGGTVLARYRRVAATISVEKNTHKLERAERCPDTGGLGNRQRSARDHPAVSIC